MIKLTKQGIEDMEPTKKEIDDFIGMNEINSQMADMQEQGAPICHMKPMRLDGAEDPWSGAWWECEHCGHTKDI